MNRSRLLLGIASVLAGTAALFVVFGAVYNLLFVALALPFGVASFFLWFDATGRLRKRIRSRQIRAEQARRRQTARTSPGAGPRRTTGSQRRPQQPEGQSRRDARRILGVGPDADSEAVRRAYRQRVKEVHPDSDDGDKEAFKRVTRAYERLRE